MATNNAINLVEGSAGQLVTNTGTGFSNTTATYPSTAGTSGKVLISDGTNIVSSTPTFPNSSATSGKIIRSDGTNWIASTPTYPTGSPTLGTIMIGDGTNYAQSTTLYPASVTWTSFTPTVTLVGGAGNVVPTYSTATGRYVQVGNVVFISVVLANGAGGTAGAGTGVINIALPVTIGASVTANTVMFCGYLTNSTTNNMLAANFSGSGTTVSLKFLSGTSLASVTGAQQNDANTRSLVFQAFYEI